MIRKYTTSDMDRCKQLVRESLDDSLGYSLEAIKEFSKEVDDQGYFKLRSGIGGIYVFEERGIHGIVCSDGEWVRKLFVKPDFNFRLNCKLVTLTKRKQTKIGCL